MNKVKISASIIGGDMCCLADELKKVEESGADMLHLDVMDGNFVDNITFGPDTVLGLRSRSKMFFDVHLMIYRVYDYVERFKKAGADRLTFQVEATEYIDDTIKFIKTCNMQVGLAISPETNPELLLPHLAKVDQVIVMTVHPGFAGQKFMEEMLDRVEFLKTMKKNHPELKFEISIDGGVGINNAKKCIGAGADILVSASALFQKGQSMRHIVNQLQGV
ncbi:MAG: ribulose-phosphate 3-epimerase [Chlamydiae bacterium]|nr:ribulose-phosphate 3-epimerase [Chlamydiota bacterium]